MANLNEMAVSLLPVLYKLSSKGKTQSWSIWTQDSTIWTKWGQIDGKHQTTSEEIKEGKNIGKANATTPEQQAEAEALSQWQGKLKKGYVADLKSARAGEVDSVIEGGIFPMLAEKFGDHAEKIKYPAYLQAKYDGERMIGDTRGNNTPTLWSRTRKQIIGLPHIAFALELLDTPLVFDGEAYNHDYKNKFEELVSFINQKKTPKEGYEVVEYHIFDLAIPNMPFSERLAKLQEVLTDCPSQLKLAPTILVNSEDEAILAFEEFLEMGYEGAIIRNADALYVNKRTTNLQKMKKFDDSEFIVVGVEEGKGKLAGHAIFVCKCEAGTFNVKMRGKTSELKKYWENPASAIGRELTVKYQKLTKYGFPRFPIAWRFKDSP